MTLAHVGRFLTRPVQCGKRYDAQVIWPINSPRSRGKCVGIVPARPSGYFLRRAGDSHRGQLGCCVELFPACCPEPGRVVHPQTLICQPLPF